MIQEIEQNKNERSIGQDPKSLEHGAFTLLYDQYAAIMMGFICELVSNKAIAEVVLEKVYVKIWNQQGSNNAQGAGILGRMMQTARETALEEIRGNADLKPFTDKIVYQAQTPGSANENLDNEQVQGIVFNEIYYNGLSCAQTASSLNITVDEVKVYFRLAIRNLKN